MTCLFIIIAAALLWGIWSAISKASEAKQKLSDSEDAAKRAFTRINHLEHRVSDLEQRFDQIPITPIPLEPVQPITQPISQPTGQPTTQSPKAAPPEPTPHVSPITPPRQESIAHPPFDVTTTPIAPITSTNQLISHKPMPPHLGATHGASTPPPTQSSPASGPTPKPATRNPSLKPAYKPIPITPPTPPISWEQRFTKSLPWLGAIALGLAGVFAVKVMSAHHLLSPAVRVIASALFGIGLIGLAQWFRAKSGRIAEAMAAAGVLILYAAVLACRVLYGDDPTIGIDANTAFVGLAIVTAGAVTLSLRHGQMVALLGLLGGFLTPAMLSSGKRPESSLFLYLICLEIGLTVLAKGRRWWWITLLAMVGGLGWAGLWIAAFFTPADAHWVALFLLASIASFVITSIRTDDNERIGGLSIATVLPWTAIVSGMSLVAWLLQQSRFSPIEWAMFGILGIGTMVLARLKSRYFPLAVLAGITTAGMLAAQGLLSYHGTAQDAAALGWTTLCLGLIYTVGAYICMWNSRRPHSQPLSWLALSILSSVVFTAIGYTFVSSTLPNINPPWWFIITSIAILHAFGAIPLHIRRASLERGDDMLGAMVVAITGFLSWALVLFIGKYEMGPQWIAIGWSLEVVALGVCATWLNLPNLHKIIALSAAVVAIRLVANPAILHYDFGTGIIAWWLLYGYGIPTGAFILAAWLVRRQNNESLASFLEAASAAFVLVMFTLGIRHAFHPEAIADGSFGLNEIGSYTAAWIVMGLFMLTMAERWSGSVIQIGSRIVFFLGLFIVLAGAGIFQNPLWSSQHIGPAILFNDLLFIYGLPAALSAIGAWLLTKRGDVATATVAGAASILLALMTGGLMVHHGFHVDAMNTSEVSLFEQATLAVVWLNMAIAMLLVGSHRRTPILRQGGMVVLALGLFTAIFGTCILANPLWNPTPMSTLIIVNPLLYIYGVPMLLAAFSAWLLRRVNEPMASGIATGCATLLGVVLIGMEIHHGFHGGNLVASHFTLVEMATLSIAWGLVAVGLTLIGRTLKAGPIQFAAEALIGLSLVTMILGTLILGNPLVGHEDVGAMPIVNWILYSYGMPTLLAILGAWDAAKRNQAKSSRIYRAIALLMGFALLTLEIRQGFQGNFLDSGLPTNAEWFAYSVAWIIFAGVLLTIGLLTRSKGLRLASMTVMFAAVLKVFLFDTRHLQDEWRVLSYFGLGVSLLVLAWTYQKYVFGSGNKTPESSPSEPTTPAEPREPEFELESSEESK